MRISCQGVDTINTGVCGQFGEKRDSHCLQGRLAGFDGLTQQLIDCRGRPALARRYLCPISPGSQVPSPSHVSLY